MRSRTSLLAAVAIFAIAGLFVVSQTKNTAAPQSQPATVAQVQNSDPAVVSRVEDPYSQPPTPFSAIRRLTLSALVNILCSSDGEDIRPISGSGVLIDPRGVILTSAHVAQYVLLSEDPRVGLSCSIRIGSPARDTWNVEVLYLPPIWVQLHAKDLMATAPKGTGEHDYALLRVSDAEVPTPFVVADTREGIAFLGDETLVAAYPAEFVGSAAAQSQLFPAASVTALRDLLTFTSTSIDLMSLGGVVEAQSGSSGGAVVNAWGRLVGLIATTGEGATPAERDLRALTLAYIDRDLQLQAGVNLATLLQGNLAEQSAQFKAEAAPALVELLIERLR